MNSVTSIAASALAAFGVKQAVTANNVANVNTPDYRAAKVVMEEDEAGGVSAAISQGSDIVEISKEATDMITTSHSFKANIKVLQAADEMSKELLNIKA
jgi:flagellar hook-associated protein FlgK